MPEHFVTVIVSMHERP